MDYIQEDIILQNRSSQNLIKKKLRDLSPRANYTDRATAA
jgi:hypothetical protein